jgi:type I protein arginine methyltransferase
MSFLGLGIHGQMLADRERNAALFRAVRCVVRPGDVVADVGGGTGVLAMFAVRAGASRVYCIEATALAALARSLVLDNGMADRVEVIAGVAQETRLPELCDVVISETLGFMGLDEGFRSVMVDARERFLRGGGALLPSSLRLRVAAVERSPRLPDVRVEGALEGLDFGRAFRVFGKIPRRTHVSADLYLSAPETLVALDCMTMTSSGALAFSTSLRCRRNGVLAGFVLWFEATLAEGVVLASSSAHPANHWGQAYLAAQADRLVEAGSTLTLAGSISDAPGRFNFDWSSSERLPAAEDAVA